MLYLLRYLLGVSIILSPLFGFIYLMFAIINGIGKRHALKYGMESSEELKQELKNSLGDITVTTEDRLRFVKKSVSSSIKTFLVAEVLSLSPCILFPDAFDMMLTMFFLVLFCSALLVLKDAIKVAPWNDIHCIKSLHTYHMSGRLKRDYVFYYDFLKGEFAADKLPSCTSVFEAGGNAGGFNDVLVIIGRKRLKVVGIMY